MEKNEKMTKRDFFLKKTKEKRKKMEKNDEKRKTNEEIWIQTQNPRRFPVFTVVVVTFSVKILDDFHDFVSECVSFQRKINNPFWGVTVFSERKVTNFIVGGLGVVVASHCVQDTQFCQGCVPAFFSADPECRIWTSAVPHCCRS